MYTFESSKLTVQRNFMDSQARHGSIHASLTAEKILAHVQQVLVGIEEALRYILHLNKGGQG